jgi:hypothetical protein
MPLFGLSQPPFIPPFFAIFPDFFLIFPIFLPQTARERGEGGRWWDAVFPRWTGSARYGHPIDRTGCFSLKSHPFEAAFGGTHSARCPVYFTIFLQFFGMFYAGDNEPNRVYIN